MPCECNTICNTSTFSWNIVGPNIAVICKKCNKSVFLGDTQNPLTALINLENDDNNSEQNKETQTKRFPITIKEAKANLDTYLASLVEPVEEIITPKKEELIH